MLYQKECHYLPAGFTICLCAVPGTKYSASQTWGNLSAAANQQAVFLKINHQPTDVDDFIKTFNVHLVQRKNLCWTVHNLVATRFQSATFQSGYLTLALECWKIMRTGFVVWMMLRMQWKKVGFDLIFPMGEGEVMTSWCRNKGDSISSRNLAYSSGGQ